jgi:molybdopterin synthase sulfur carrier subunit
MKVLIASPLRSYTDGRSWVEADGSTLGEVLDDLERQFPGIRFRMIDEQERMRRHVRFFVNGEQTFELAHPLRLADELCIVQALSGG